METLTLYSYLYKDKQGITRRETLEARHSVEALHNARVKVFMAGGDAQHVYITN